MDRSFGVLLMAAALTALWLYDTGRLDAVWSAIQYGKKFYPQIGASGAPASGPQPVPKTGPPPLQPVPGFPQEGIPNMGPFFKNAPQPTF